MGAVVLSLRVERNRDTLFYTLQQKNLTMRRIPGIILWLVLCVGFLPTVAEVTVTNVTATPRWPWNGLTDINYTIEYEGAANIKVELSGWDNDRNCAVEMTSVTGPGVTETIYTDLAHTASTYTVVWDAAADDPGIHSSDFTVTVKIKQLLVSDYLVVDLSGGSSATSYPIRYSATGPDLSDDICRTTELWLRRIPSGSFTMGSPSDEVGRLSNETQHEVLLTEDFYIGVFECTQKQYKLVMGTNPSEYTGDTRPVERVSYNMIRGTGSTAGAGWPVYGHAVDADSFMGVLQAKTGLTFDLPTEAQWEYACRAGTTTALNSGKNLSSTNEDANMAEVGRYSYNKSDGKGGYSQHTKVGSYRPNNWGLYDMHGNVWEWCLDWKQEDLGNDAVTNPMGASSGSYRVQHGGSWGTDHAARCRSAYRNSLAPSGDNKGNHGFRVAAMVQVSSSQQRNQVSVNGASSANTYYAPGEIVVLTAELPEGATAEDYDIVWTLEPAVDFTASGDTASFTMPSEPISVTCQVTKKNNAEELYLVVDLSGGSSAASYPIRYSATGPDLSDDTCRTTELWLRRIRAGTFMMGSPEDEVGRVSERETQHQVTLTQDFYIGVFECTQKQYQLVMGTNPSSYKGDTRPVDSVSYNMIRGTGSTAGAGWPAYGHSVDASSFMGKLQAKTGLTFDLPTEAQWEYACRAGTDTALNSGKNLTNADEDANMAEVGRYYYNKSDGKGGYSEHTKVGCYLPNAWGLYDMHGNGYEWCLDWDQSDLGSSAVTDPVGASSGSSRVIRSGSWDGNYGIARGCRSAVRFSVSPSYNPYCGFRIAACTSAQ